MNVELSLIIDLRSSARSVIIQSSLRGRIAVSFENVLLRWQYMYVKICLTLHARVKVLCTLFKET